ncbi:hypothetical protein M231_04905 [Tremella mesenterica]|uniref:Uncharacterized protein n=1 Tax=Tremella mesenterica TaxID=5217 RepID=A0A4Q1BJJ1_TREME|nr:hypothetical protein M231_04905 [Tremella mesenterica]
MASDRDLNIGKAFEETLCSTLARMSAPSPRQVSSIGLGSLAITDGSASPAAAGTSVGVAPTPSSVPASLSQHEAQPARPGLSPTLGRTTTVVEIGSDEDEDMGEGERVEADDEMEGGEDMPEDGGSKVSDTSLVARIRAMSPIHIDEKGSPEIYVRGQNSNGYVHVAYYKEQARVKAEKEQKRGRTSDTVDNAPPPSAIKAKGARPSSSTSGQAGSPRTVRDKNTLWNLFAAERDQWEVCSVEESCDRCRREIVTYGRKSWPCLRPVKPHNRGSRCASCTTGPCSFFPGNPARGFPPRSTDHSPLPPPINWGSPSSNPFMVQSTPATPSPSMRRRLPTANDDGFPSPVPLANLASSRPSPPTVGSSRPLLADEDIERFTCPPSPAVAGPSRPTPRRSPGSRPTATPSAGPSPPVRSRPTPTTRPSQSPAPTLPPAHGTRSRQPSLPPSSGLPSALSSVKTPLSKSPKGKGKKKAVSFDQEVEETEESTQQSEEIPPLVHPFISEDPRVPDEEKQFATFRSAHF